ncbi:sensor histidine kinase [Anaeromicrobium sediminis]|uniref:HAMP domain-containing protein n=1 Tax=Anaeromicrobium sediminis TaxID=1478221 RepID=A0A267MLL4_9FIRM|nr:sensor histidine kinase [Anaeromicrobium sediminis]PAB59660.1 hypothetical protein CCE28_08825 [Anaeromicrobium sediminis]
MIFENRTFRSRLFKLFMLIGTIPLVLMAIFSYYNTSYRISDKIDNSTQENMAIMEELIDSTIVNLGSISDFIVENKEIQNILKKTEYKTYEERFEDVQKVYTIVNSIEVRRMDIPIYILGLNTPYSRFTTQPYFSNMYGSKQSYLIRKFMDYDRDKFFYVHRKVDGRESKDTVLTIVRKIRDLETDTVLGFVFLDIYDEYFDNIFKKFNLYEDSNIFILDQNGIIITDNKYKTETTFKYNDRCLEIINEGKNNPFEFNMKNMKYKVYYTTLKNTKFTIVRLIPLRHINYEKRIIIETFIGIFVILFISSILISYLLSNKISEPIKKLSTTMEEVEKGRLDISIDLTNCDDEIYNLGKTFNKMIEKINILIEEVYMKKYLLKEAELKNLKSQINPHFLYNSLESIKWMAKLGENKKVSKMITSLGRFLRYSISKTDDIVTIREDLTQIENYLKIMRLRFEDKLTIEYDIDQTIMDEKMPKLLIQPLVENALIHGIEKNTDKGIIIIKVYRSAENIVFEIIDNGMNFKKDFKMGIGLSNVDKRVKLYYGKEYGIRFNRVDNKTYCKLTIGENLQGEEVHGESINS